LSFSNSSVPNFSSPNPFATRFTQPGAIPYHFPTDVSLESLATQFFHQHRGRAAIVGPHGSGKTSLLYAISPHLGIIHQHHLCQGDPVPKTLLHQHPHQLHHAEDTTQHDEQNKTSPPISHAKQIHWYRLMSHRGHSFPSSVSDRPATEDSRRILLRSAKKWNRNSLVIIDGWEQLSPMLRVWMFWAIRRTSSNILVTSHRPTLFPTLWTTDVQPDIAQRVVQSLLDRHAEETSADTSGIEAQKEIGSWKPSQELLQDRLVEQQGSLREVLFVLYDDFERTCRSRIGKGS
jgi:(2Fe-2S) ferredoxin